MKLFIRAYLNSSLDHGSETFVKDIEKQFDFEHTLLSTDTKPYWKIPEYTEVEFSYDIDSIEKNYKLDFFRRLSGGFELIDTPGEFSAMYANPVGDLFEGHNVIWLSISFTMQ